MSLVAVLIAAPLALAAGPTTTSYNTKLHLAGDATHHGNSALVPAESFQYELRVAGVTSFIGNRFAGTLTGTINITYQDANNQTVIVDSEPVTIAVHGERASFLNQGVDGFRTTVQQQGQSGNLKAFVIPGAFTSGVSTNDDGSKDYTLTDQGHGQAQFKDTQHWALDVAGDFVLSPQ